MRRESLQTLTTEEEEKKTLCLLPAFVFFLIMVILEPQPLLLCLESGAGKSFNHGGRRATQREQLFHLCMNDCPLNSAIFAQICL